MPRTPVEVRPLNTRTSGTGKRRHLPARVASSTSLSSPHRLTPTRLSPSFSFMAILPLAFTLVKSARSLRRTLPAAVANIRCWPCHSPSSTGSGITVVMYSPSASGSRLTIALPRDCGLPTGRR